MVYVENRLDAPVGNDAPDVDGWLAALSGQYTERELALLRRACEMAQRAHGGQLRASGEPYLHHVLAVADILVDLRLDSETVAAAILHDAVEDTTVTLEEIGQEFGSSIARMVDGVTKIELIHSFSGSGAQQAESLRKLLLAMAEDVRVVLIKLADRLHNMRTLKHLAPEKQRRIARETQEIYAPLANRLGIWQLKWELEDLAFRHLEPDTYRRLARSLDERRVGREQYIDDVIQQLSAALREAGIEAQVTGRPKHIYSIWRKMQRKGVGLDQLYDLRAVRILVNQVADCYHALGVVHTLWRYIPREFDDYIATPKENHYQSIHTAVIGPQGRTLEVQIRTHEMHRHAELGVAAHWVYKEGGARDSGFEQKIAWLRQLLEWKEESRDAGDFIDRFKSELFQDRVYVLTPQGDILDLPQGATPLDFAYAVHTEVGHRCRGARVDGRIVPLTCELKSGQQVEIMTTRHGAPSRDWLNPQLGYVKSSRARSKILAWFKQQDQEKHISDGKLVLERELRRLGAAALDMDRLVKELKYQEQRELLAAIGRGEVTTAQIAGAVHRLQPPAVQRGEPSRPLRGPREQKGGDIRIHGVGNLLTHLARCCKPVPGDSVIGYITLGRGVSIHRRDCSNILNLDNDKRSRLIEVEWRSSEPGESYQVEVNLRAVDRSGLLRDITTILAAEDVNVLSVNTDTDPKQGIATMKLTLSIHDTAQLSKVLNRIAQLPNVLEAWRQG